jgi:holo-[acyl-carrier protein] synthase
MIIGIGIDIVQIERMERWIDNPKLLNRYFHSEELLTISEKKTSIAQTLAARFAAKEAFGKALGTGLTQIALKDIMILNRENGKPEIKLSGSAQEAFIKSGASKAHVSLSHEKENAIAIIILEV